MSSLSNGRAREPLAIIGLGCRFPGGASSPEALWSLVTDGRHGFREVPPDRWDVRRYYDPDPKRPGKMYVREAGFLREPIAAFDPIAFGIAPRDAESMDPQQRLLLETTWEALDDAGRPQGALRGADVGVFVGGFTLDNMGIQYAYENQSLISAGSATSASHTMLANRISHVFDLRGPSLTVDTACSSSLTAFHLACRSLWAGECSLAIVGGVNAILRPGFMVAMCKGGFLAPDGRCKTFQRRADGYARGEGAGVAVLAPLSVAQRAGDRVYASVLATAANQDGRTPGISQPNRRAQVALLRAVLAEADIPPSAVRYVEAHGTGTQAGDAAEAHALDEVLGEGRPPENKLIVGALKQNLGHLEAAAGIAGVIKTALALHHREVPRNLWADDPSPEIPFASMCLEFSDEPRPLGETDPVIAGVNSFGYGGANAHAILASVTAPERTEPVPWTRGAFALPISARDDAALMQRAADLARFVAERPEVAVEDVAHTLIHRSSHHDCRAVVVAEGRDDLAAALGALGRGAVDRRIVTGHAGAAPPPLVFAFTGMGPQWWAMGRELMATEPVYAETIGAIDALFFEHAGWSIADALAADEDSSEISQTRVAQPTNFALQIALTRLWQSWGIEPAAVVGHSVGEVAAAHVAGALSLEDAVYLSYHRSRLQQAMALTGMRRGAMLAAAIGPDRAAELVGAVEGTAIAAFNAPDSVTLSGDEAGIDEIARRLERDQVFHRRLDVEVAYHSHHMEHLRAPLAKALADLSARPPALPFASTVSGTLYEEPLGAEYFCRNMREPVRFEGAVKALADRGYRVFVEIGPHPVLRNAIAGILGELGIRGKTVASLRRREPERAQMLQGLGDLYAAGHAPAFDAVAPTGGSLVRLPAYPFQRSELWIESKESRELAGTGGGSSHELLQRRLPAPRPRWRSELSPALLPWLTDHRIQGMMIVPGAAYVEAALAMARALDTGSGGVWLEDIDFRRLLAIDSKRVIDADLECDPSAGRFGVFAGERGGDERALHACGRLAWVGPGPDEQRVDVGAIQRRLGAGRATPEGLYASMRRVGLEYGPQFRTIASAFGPGPGDGQPEVLVRLQLPENVGDGADYLVHPALLDGSFQAALSLIAEGSESRPWVPVAIERVRFCAPPRRSAWAHVRLQRRSAREAELEVTLADDDGRVCLALSGVSIQPMVAGEVRERADGLFSYAWQPLGDGAKPRAVPVWLAGEPDDTRPLAAALAAHSSARVEASRLSGPGAFGEVPPDVERVAIVVPDERRRPAELAETLGAHIAALAGALARRPSPPSLVVIATGGDRSGSRLAGEALAGLLRVVRAEAPELEARCVFASHPGDAPWDAIAAELLRPDAEPEIRLSANGREGRRLVRREIDAAAPRPAAPVRTSEAAVELAIDRPGAMGTIHHRMSQRRAPGRGELEIRVEAAALNFKDVLKLAGQLDPRAVRDTFFGDSLGMECVGVVERAGAGAHGFEPGDRVMALPPGGCFRSFLTCHASTVGRLPCDLSPTAGAGLVIPYLTAWHSLLEVARIEPGETVLVHHASGGVGFAAIQVARLRSARVIATAGTEEKRAFVRSLGVQHVSDSRSLAFVDDVRRATGGRGVDVVLGAMAGDMLVQSLRLLARYGRCIDIGKRAQIEDADLPLRAFNEALTYAAIDMDRRLRDRPAACMKVIGEILETIETGKLPAVPVQVVAAERAADAFRTMAQARHVGRLVLDYDDRPVEARAHPATGDTPIRRDATYVVTGGLGGFGLEVARWLAEKGAGALVLIGRRGLETPGAAAAVEALEARGARVIAAAIDVADEAALRRELSAARAALPPIRGVFHGAMVLDDHRLDEMTAAAFARVLRPKAQGAWNLHTVTESDPIEHFVAFSSVAVAVGNPGQSNYVTANAFLDGLMAQRRREGKPGTSIQWGVLGDVGVALRTGVHEQLEAAGMVPLSTDEALSALEQAICGRLARDDARLGVFELDWQRFAARAPQASQPLFSKLGGGRSSLSSPRVRAAVGLLSAPPEARTDLVTRELAERAGEVLRMEAAQIGAERSLAELGVDSLGAVEIATALAAGGYPLTEMDLMTGEPINSLAERATARLYATLAEHRAALLASDDALTDEQRGRLVELAPATEERP